MGKLPGLIAIGVGLYMLWQQQAEASTLVVSGAARPGKAATPAPGPNLAAIAKKLGIPLAAAAVKLGGQTLFASIFGPSGLTVEEAAQAGIEIGVLLDESYEGPVPFGELDDGTQLVIDRGELTVPEPEAMILEQPGELSFIEENLPDVAEGALEPGIELLGTTGEVFPELVGGVPTLLEPLLLPSGEILVKAVAVNLPQPLPGVPMPELPAPEDGTQLVIDRGELTLPEPEAMLLEQPGELSFIEENLPDVAEGALEPGIELLGTTGEVFPELVGGVPTLLEPLLLPSGEILVKAVAVNLPQPLPGVPMPELPAPEGGFNAPDFISLEGAAGALVGAGGGFGLSQIEALEGTPAPAFGGAIVGGATTAALQGTSIIAGSVAALPLAGAGVILTELITAITGSKRKAALEAGAKLGNILVSGTLESTRKALSLAQNVEDVNVMLEAYLTINKNFWVSPIQPIGLAFFAFLEKLSPITTLFESAYRRFGVNIQRPKVNQTLVRFFFTNAIQFMRNGAFSIQAALLNLVPEQRTLTQFAFGQETFTSAETTDLREGLNIQNAVARITEFQRRSEVIRLARQAESAFMPGDLVKKRQELATSRFTFFGA